MHYAVAFASGALAVLVCTSTLAWGVNLPARAVIIKGAHYFDPSVGKSVALGPLELLQMFGRCCSVLQCVAVCCSVLQCVAMCCNGMQCATVFCVLCLSSWSFILKTCCAWSAEVAVDVWKVLRCGALCRSVMQCVAVWYSVE